MRRRRLMLVVGTVAVLGAGFALFPWLTSPTPGVTWENYHRLRIGMTVKEAEDLLGEAHNTNERYADENQIVKKWRNDKIDIYLHFSTGRLLLGAASPVGPDGKNDDSVPVQFVPTDFLDRIRRWLPWRRRARWNP